MKFTTIVVIKADSVTLNNIKQRLSEKLDETICKDALIQQCQKKINEPLERLNFFDYYNIFDLQITDDLLDMVDGYDRFPDAIITPDLKLIRAPKAFMLIDESSRDYQEFLNWQKDFKKILEEYSNNSFSLILDCQA